MDERKRGVSVNELQIFNNEEFGEIRTITKDNEPMFCLMDICKALGMKNPTMVASRLEDDEVTKFDLGSKRGETQTVASICQIRRERKRLVCLKGQAQRAEWLDRTADVCHSKGKRNIPFAFGRKGVSLLFRR